MKIKTDIGNKLLGVERVYGRMIVVLMKIKTDIGNKLLGVERVYGASKVKSDANM